MTGTTALKINLPFVKGSLPRTNDATRPSDAGKSQADGKTSSRSGSPVELSSTARHLAQLSHTEADINIVRVNEIRNALEQGTLKINPERIADSLIASAHELITKK